MVDKVLKNCTSRALIIRTETGELNLPKSDVVYRCRMYRYEVGRVSGVGLYAWSPGVIVPPLPEPDGQTIYIVNTDVAERARRPDVVSPGLLVRGPNGRIHGCGGLIVHAEDEP